MYFNLVETIGRRFVVTKLVKLSDEFVKRISVLSQITYKLEC